MQLNKKKIPVLFITYNRLYYTRKSLQALLDNTDMAEIVVIDNGSTDGTLDFLHAKQYEPVNGQLFHLIENKENKGLAYAINQFMELTEGFKYVAKVDNDTVVPKNWLDKLVNAIDETGIDIVQACHFFISDTYENWDDLKAHRTITPTVFGNIINMPNVGGSGIVIRREKMDRLPEKKDLTPFWIWQRDNPDLKKGFLDSVWVDLLDMENNNKHKNDIEKEYYVETERIVLNEKVSIILPVIRPDKAKRCIDSIHSHAGISKSNYEIITEEDTERIGCPEMVKRLVSRAKHDLILFMGDDTIGKPNFIRHAICDMDKFEDKWGLVGINDGSLNEAPAHWLAHKKLLSLVNGEFFSTEYTHCKCDVELKDIAEENNRFIMSNKSWLIHDHPLINKEHSDDPDYARVYSKEIWDKDKKTYYRRKRDRLQKIAIAFPLVESTLHCQFFISFLGMQKPSEYIVLMPTFPSGSFSTSIADARNSIIDQALSCGVKWLLMMDTDQVYPENTYTKLMSNMDKCDVCGVLVHKRWMPFNPVLYRGKIGEYTLIPDEEIFNDNFIEVDATGTGCLLYNMNLFDKIEKPYFLITAHNNNVVGEDIYFCNKARENGIKIVVDTSIKVDHLTTIGVNEYLYKICKHLNRGG